MTVDKFIAQLNITHFREKLATEQDGTKRQTLLRVLAHEEAKLATVLGSRQKAKAVPPFKAALRFAQA